MALNLKSLASAATAAQPAKRTLAVSLEEEQLLLRLRATRRKMMYIVFVGGDGKVKMCEDLTSLLDLQKIAGGS